MHIMPSIRFVLKSDQSERGTAGPLKSALRERPAGPYGIAEQRGTSVGGKKGPTTTRRRNDERGRDDLFPRRKNIRYTWRRRQGWSTLVFTVNVKHALLGPTLPRSGINAVVSSSFSRFVCQRILHFSCSRERAPGANDGDPQVAPCSAQRARRTTPTETRIHV